MLHQSHHDTAQKFNIYRMNYTKLCTAKNINGRLPTMCPDVQKLQQKNRSSDVSDAQEVKTEVSDKPLMAPSITTYHITQWVTPTNATTNHTDYNLQLFTTRYTTGEQFLLHLDLAWKTTIRYLLSERLSSTT